MSGQVSPFSQSSSSVPLLPPERNPNDVYTSAVLESSQAAQQPPQLRTQSTSTSRRHKRRRNNQTAAAIPDTATHSEDVIPFNSPVNVRRNSAFYLQRNSSNTSMDSTALLDHREQLSMRPRRSSAANFASTAYDLSRALWRGRRDGRAGHEGTSEDEGHDNDEDDTAPLVKPGERTSLLGGRHRTARPSTAEAGSRGARLQPFRPSAPGVLEYGSVNCPPSIPTSPNLKPLDSTRGGLSGYDMSARRNGGVIDTIIDVEPEIRSDQSRPSSSSRSSAFDNCPSLRTATNLAEEDVCFPVDDGLLDEEDEAAALNGSHYLTERSGRRRREWPDMIVLEEWSREEKEERSEGIRAKKLPEPVYVGGRLRPPIGPPWHRNEDESPYRFTYFNEDLPATIHSHTISELLQPGQSFNDLFRPEPRVLDDSSGDDTPQATSKSRQTESRASDGYDSRNDLTPPEPSQSLPKLGSRPTFWLDVLKPTEAEMKVISKAFGIHPLTTEDIMMQETREKVELFRSYYLVSYRTFEQDNNSEDFMQPVNIYVVVFRDGVISFHFSMTPHPANVRRRIRQLKDYITVSADWISYALIDDITDAFGPLIHSLEKEVDDTHDAILRMHVDQEASDAKSVSASHHGEDDGEQKSDGEMLKRVGDSRRNVTSLYRLMGNKADVIKGFAKRCNEQWEVAPRSEIGLYLGDIQDHIITMVSNLNHMERILSRSHSNYLAQINIKMNERQERTADVLGRLTVLGTIVLPMNIITGLWGMNVLVPGQEVENLDWFWCIAAGLVVFGFLCYYVAKRVYKIM